MRNPLHLIGDGLAALLGSVTHDQKHGVCTKDCWCQIAARVIAHHADMNEGPMAPTKKDKFTLTMESEMAREAVIAAACGLVSARIYADLHPADSSGGADIELREDMLDEAINEAYIRRIVSDVAA